MRSKTIHAGLAFTVATLMVLLSTVETLTPSVEAHSLKEFNIYSRYSQTPITIDGIISNAEWFNATVVNLTTIPFNTVNAYLLVQNSNSMLYIAYDVVGDKTQDAGDSAALAFDGDHDGTPTLQGDGEYSIKASSDASCLPYDSVRCHYVYSGSGEDWDASDPMDQGKPFQAGLWATANFGPSLRTSISHRMYEFSIPLALIGQPTSMVGPGDVVGFFASRHTSPFVGVWDAGTSKSASWPRNALLGPNEYGHLYIAAQTASSLNPDYSYKATNNSQPAIHRLTLRNLGRIIDSFDLRVTSSSGWTVNLSDDLGNPLTDNGGNSLLPDIGPLNPMESRIVVASITPLPSASPGDVDETTLMVEPWSNPLATSSGLLRSAIPFLAPWSDNLEGGAQGWYDIPIQVNDWELGTPNPIFPGGPPTAHSGVSVWGTNLSGNFSFSSLSILESPYVLFPDYVTAAFLSFWHWYDISAPYRDGAWVEVSVDGGEWIIISPEGAYPTQRFGGYEAYAGSSGGWVQAEFNLTQYAGKPLAFRFILWDWLPVGESGGWYIDDVMIQVALPPVGVRLIPTSAYMVGSKLTSLEVPIQIQNTGISVDTFDLTYSQSLGWSVSFLNASGLPLTDTEMPPDGFPDTGPVNSGDLVTVRLNVTIPITATPGEIETVTTVFRSSQDITISASGQYKFQLALPIPFIDDMESIITGWTPDSGSLWHRVDSCAPSPPPWHISYSACQSWWYGQDFKGNYDTGFRTKGNLTSPPIELFSVSAAYLSFRYWYDTEPTMEYDQRWIFIKEDNGPWPKKGELGSYHMGLITEETWLLGSINVSAFIGHIIQIRFYFDSIDAQNNNYQGWYLDDVNVSAYTPGSLPPNIALNRPRANDLWTAAYPQDIRWNASDDLDPASVLVVWVNYSLTGSAPWSQVPGAQGVAGDSSPITWTPPCENTTNAALNATVRDILGHFSWTGPIRFGLDCKKPEVIGSSPHSPPGVSVKSNVSVVFDEAMNKTTTQNAFSLQKVQGWVSVAGDFFWVGNTLYFTPLADLETLTIYQVNVSTQATDVSIPGNPLLRVDSWQFETSSIADSPPNITIMSPGGGEQWSGSTPTNPVFKTLMWQVIDDFDSQIDLRVWVNYTVDNGTSWTPISTSQPFNGTLSLYAWQVPCANSTESAIGIDAIDTGGKRQHKESSKFAIDCSPPDIVSYSPAGNVVLPYADIIIRFNESMNQAMTQAALNLSKLPEGTPVAGLFSWATNTMTYNPGQDLVRGSWYVVTLSTLARDSSDPGNNIISEFSWQFRIEQIPPPTVNRTNPANGSVNVPFDLNRIEIVFNTTVSVFPGAVNITPPIVFDFTTSGTLLALDILGQLEYDTTYTVILNASLIMDVYSNRLDGNGDGIGGDSYTFVFTTESRPADELQIPAWVWSIPIIVIGFLIALMLYRWLKKKDEKEEIIEVKKKPKSPYKETLGPKAEIETEPYEEEPSEFSRPPPF